MSENNLQNNPAFDILSILPRSQENLEFLNILERSWISSKIFPEHARSWQDFQDAERREYYCQGCKILYFDFMISYDLQGPNVSELSL